MAGFFETADIGASERGQAAAGVVLQESAVIGYLDRVSGFSVDATDHRYYPTDQRSSGQGRALGDNYTRTNVTPGPAQTGRLSFYGDAITVDISHRRDEELGLEMVDERLDADLMERVVDWSEGVDMKLVGGDSGVTATDIDGLATILDGSAVAGFSNYTGYYDPTGHFGGGNFVDLTDEANWDLAIEMLQLVLGRIRGRANGILCNEYAHTRWTTICRRKHVLGEARDQFGNMQPAFGGVPFVQVDDEAIPSDEANKNASATDTTSLYVARAGQATGLSLSTNASLYFRDIGEMDEQEKETVRWELRGKWKITKRDRIFRVPYLKV